MRILKLFLTVAGLLLATLAGVFAIAIVGIAIVAYLVSRKLRQPGPRAASHRQPPPGDVIEVTAREVPPRPSETPNPPR